MIFRRACEIFVAISLLSPLFTSPLTAGQSGTSPDCEQIRSAIAEGLGELPSIQGVSVAVYSPDRPCALAFGVTDIDTQEPVTPDTSFYIASSTKSMFALALAALDARGENDLDESIAEFAPSAPFSRKIQTDRITLRHLLAMSSGIKNPAFVHRVAFSGEHTPEELWALISATQRNRSRDIQLGKFRYTNWSYNLAARLIEEDRAKPWQDLLDEEIFSKLGMSRTSAYMSRATRENWSLARPHATLEPDGVKRTYLEKVDSTMHSAGGVIMSANDAVKWLALFVDDGRVDGQQIFPADVIRSTRASLAKVDSEFAGFKRAHYGLGWYMGPYKDTENLLVHHFGGFSGARAHVSYMPDQDIGVAIFVNDSMVGSRFVDSVAQLIYDQALGIEGADTRYQDAIEGTRQWASDIRSRLRSLRGEIAERPWRLSAAKTGHVGTYTHKEFGTVEVTYDNDTLTVRNGRMYSVAQPGTEANTVRVELVPLEGEEIEFGYGRAGKVKNLTYKGVVFERRN